MRRLALGLALALLAFGRPASAQSVTGMTPCVLSTSAAVVCPGTSGRNGVIAQVQNNTLVSQTVTVSCVWPGGSLEMGALGISQIITLGSGPFYGYPFSQSLTCTPSAGPSGVVNVGDGIIIWWAVR